MLGAEVAEHRTKLLDAHMEGVFVLVVDVADRAVEVTGAGDGDHRQPYLLRVALAGAAVKGAAALYRLLRRGRREAGLYLPRALIPAGVGREPDLLRAVRRAGLLHKNFARGPRHHPR